MKTYSKMEYYNKVLGIYTIWNTITFLITIFGLQPVWKDGLSVYFGLIPFAFNIAVMQIVLKRLK